MEHHPHIKHFIHEGAQKIITILMVSAIIILVIPPKSIACSSFNSLPDHDIPGISMKTKGMSSSGYMENATGLKSKSRARIHSLVFTAAPVGLSRVASTGWKLSDQSIASMILFASGSVIGPSAGSIYANDWGIIGTGVIIRSLSLAFLVTGSFLNEYDDQHLQGIGRVMQLGGLAFHVGRATYDIFIVSAHSVEYHNAKVKMGIGVSSLRSFEKNATKYPELQIQVPF
ncbi:hypothetical protein [Natronogracilivirga saccharolytica]|uniref:Uncharacterized protein n=1 Tax=Natronogracilivirga saccharolytica TaxID=2812953 RepID=A0A8J7S8M1_9BACT|nr:hypothetical protein [Natronogracilivirga saccharolytica]MBP3193978.1 hypothetical protein [Natronogracilivirga saccharolytica]